MLLSHVILNFSPIKKRVQFDALRIIQINIIQLKKNIL